jgi:hypothetical protein
MADRVKTKIGSRYLAGFVLAEMDSREDFGDSENDYLIKRLFVQVEVDEQDITESPELVAFIEVETSENGVNEIVMGVVDIYRMPFPHDLNVRKHILRMMKSHPKFFAF